MKKETKPIEPTEPDINHWNDVDREILRRLHLMAVKKAKEFPTGFMYDPTVKDEVQEEGQRITSLFEHVLNQEKARAMFPEDIIKTLDALGYVKNGLNYYSADTNKLKIEFSINNGMLSCKNITTFKNIFTIDANIEVGYFIVILQAYGIINHRYIYERIDAIRDQFDEINNLNQ